LFDKLAQHEDEKIRKAYEHIIQYTGSSSTSMNDVLRSNYKYVMAGEDIEADNSEDYNTPSQLKSARAATIFDHMPPLPEATWVYRNADIPNVDSFTIGDDIIDPGFMSTSMRNTISLGNGGNSRLTIYLPKGSIVMPVLKHSHHSQENEIILPPLSIIRPLEIVRVKGHKHRFHMKCVLIGTGYKDFIERFKKSLSINEETANTKAYYMTEAKKTNKQAEAENKGKWGAMSDAMEMKQIQKDIENGKLKVKTNKLKK
jgi:anti-sigma28 factor (negative regulator of flagellin synthesis)